jgi:hypothetical protein
MGAGYTGLYGPHTHSLPSVLHSPTGRGQVITGRRHGPVVLAELVHGEEVRHVRPPLGVLVPVNRAVPPIRHVPHSSRLLTSRPIRHGASVENVSRVHQSRTTRHVSIGTSLAGRVRALSPESCHPAGLSARTHAAPISPPHSLFRSRPGLCSGPPCRRGGLRFSLRFSRGRGEGGGGGLPIGHEGHEQVHLRRPARCVSPGAAASA